MTSKEEAFMAKLMATFHLEAEEHLRQLSAGILALEEGPPEEKRKVLLETIFREAHSLKGASRTVNHATIQNICQSLEDVLSELLQGTLQGSTELFDILYKTVDFIGHVISQDKEKGSFKDHEQLNTLVGQLEGVLASKGSIKDTPAKFKEAEPIAKSLEAKKSSSETLIRASRKANTHTSKEITAQEPMKTAPSMAHANAETANPTYHSDKTIRVSLPKLDKLFQQVEELLVSKLTVQQQNEELKGVGNFLQQWDKELNRLVSLAQMLQDNGQSRHSVDIDKLKKYSEMAIKQQQNMKVFREHYNRIVKVTGQNFRFISSTVDVLLDQIKKVLMQPFSTLAESFPRMVRDISHNLGKEVHLDIQGGDIEVDRRILEELKDPLIHIISNAIDHGLETKVEREQAGKNIIGSITITVSEVGGHNMELLVSDDGRGINIKKVKDKLLQNGIIQVEQQDQWSDEEVLQRLFHSNISTSEIITELSGRGLGLGIVAEKVDKLGGQVKISSKEGQGTTFRILLPLTLATFRGIHLQVAEQDFILPTHNVKRILRLKNEEIKTMENRSFVNVEGKNIPYTSLASILELEQVDKAEKPYFYALVVKSVDKMIAFGVDMIINEQEVFVKGLGKQLTRVKNISAATVMEWGRVIPILNPNDLIKSALKGDTSIVIGKTKAADRDVKKVILLAEDSMTTRMLLKNILEAANFNVKAAVDGMEAYTLLKSEKVDLILSDIEMPRMDGLTLTEKVRQEASLQQIPIILCTSRGSKEDRERGIAVGANAYIDKSSFTQSSLLDIIKKLL